MGRLTQLTNQTAQGQPAKPHDWMNALLPHPSPQTYLMSLYDLCVTNFRHAFTWQGININLIAGNVVNSLCQYTENDRSHRCPPLRWCLAAVDAYTPINDGHLTWTSQINLSAFLSDRIGRSAFKKVGLHCQTPILTHACNAGRQFL